MAKELKLSDLTPAQKIALKKELASDLKKQEKEIREKRAGYKESVNKKLPSLFSLLTDCSKQLAAAKKKVYKELASLVNHKSDVYDREQDQTSHSFTTEEGISITIGYRQNDGWDDTVEVGIQKVTDYIQKLGKDDNSKKLVKTILQLLSKDKTGTLKASRVLQLKKLADDIGDPKLKDAIQIIQDAYRPSRSKQFITCRYKDSTGANKELPLSITDVEIDEK
jgi:hypothetical protein